MSAKMIQGAIDANIAACKSYAGSDDLGALMGWADWEAERHLTYEQFLATKVRLAPDAGFEPGEFPTGALFDWQDAIVRLAVRKGRFALFADTGLGKTRMQLCWADQVARHAGRPVLILAPLAVGPQTIAEGRRIGIDVCDAFRGGASIEIANYEQLHNLEPARYAGVVLDESSILKNFMGKTKQALVAAFADTPFRLCCTATPAPNDHMELSTHAEFLGVMTRSEMLSQWFIHDSANTQEWRLKAHGAENFYMFLASWCMMLSTPSDIGFDGSKMVLPPVAITEHLVSTEGLPAIEGRLFRDAELSATTLHAEMRLCAPRVAARVAELIESCGDEPCLVWVNTDYEAAELRKLMPGIREVKGKDPDASKVDGLVGFAEGRYRVLMTKAKIGGFGMNWQHCRNVIFFNLSYSWEAFYQMVRRCWRFGQLMDVRVHIVIPDSACGVLQAIKDKNDSNQKLRGGMQAAMNEVMEVGRAVRVLSPLPEPVVHEGATWRLINGDCVQALRREPADSVGFTVFSPPFSTLYIYSDSIADMGNTIDDRAFFTQFGYLAEELERVTKPGRLVAFHCIDLPTFKWKDGFVGRRDFPGLLIQAMQRKGFVFHSRVTIWKDPVVEMQRTKANGLLYMQLCKDSCASRQGQADYLIIMRKHRGIDDGADLVNSGAAERFYDYLGSYPPHHGEYQRGRTKEERERLYSIAVWQRYASPVWFDIRQTEVLNKDLAREEADERHICPLQLDVIDRAIELWSNPGDLVLSPYAGIGSEGYGAVRAGRRFLGVELKASYAQQAVKFLKQAEGLMKQPSLFEALEVAE